MGRPSVGEINTDSIEKKKVMISSLTELPEKSPETIFNLIFFRGRKQGNGEE